MNITQAAKCLRINPSTARIIIQNYMEYGHIYEKKSEKQ